MPAVRRGAGPEPAPRFTLRREKGYTLALVQGEQVGRFASATRVRLRAGKTVWLDTSAQRKGVTYWRKQRVRSTRSARRRSPSRSMAHCSNAIAVAGLQVGGGTVDLGGKLIFNRPDQFSSVDFLRAVAEDGGVRVTANLYVAGAKAPIIARMLYKRGSAGWVISSLDCRKPS